MGPAQRSGGGYGPSPEVLVGGMGPAQKSLMMDMGTSQRSLVTDMGTAQTMFDGGYRHSPKVIGE